MKHTLLYIYIAFFAMLLGNLEVSAQDEQAFNVVAHVSTYNSTTKETEYNVVQYVRVKTPQRANDIVAKLMEAVKIQQKANNEGSMNPEDYKAFDNAAEKMKVNFKLSAPNGDIKTRLYPSNVILICTYNPDEPETMDDIQFEVMSVSAGKTEYSHVFKKDMHSTQSIDNVNVDGTNKGALVMKALPPADDGKKMYFSIQFELPAGYGSEEGRLVVQPLAVECQTEDTVDYISGLVIEGRKYHSVQNRVMGYDYMRNDKVSYAYMPTPMWSDEPIVVDTTLVYVKPNPRMTYKIPYSVQIADMNHVYFSKSAATASCNNKNIFKFLDLGVGAADMDLAEFQIKAESQMGEKNQDLKLKFEVGKSDLTNDSVNNKNVEDLVKELRSYGERLEAVTIEATASPEGGYESNRKLAAERTQKAISMVNRSLGKVSVHYSTAAPRVCTWGEVAQKVYEEYRDSDLAGRIRQSMGQNGYGGDAVIMNFPEFKTEIQPVLEKLRMMRVTYRYEAEHVMEPEEAVAAYYEHKHDLPYMHAHFSDGDYYNLFNCIKDSAEQDSIVNIAYSHVVSQPGYWNMKFSMYVANRKAMLNLRHGKPDANVLRPFINTKYKVVNGSNGRSSKAQTNRREVLINQIITFSQMEERDTALNYLRHWFENDNSDPKVKRLKSYITFKEDFYKSAYGQLDAAEQKKFDDAMDFVFSCAKDNKAVIYGEGYEYIKRTITEADTLVSQMDDDNPKKWYLKGILAAKKETEHIETPAKKGFVPDYLCYFHHSFQLDPEYKLLYFQDGQLIDQLREKYRYRKSDYAKYEKRFAELVTVKAGAKKAAAEFDDLDDIVGDEDDEETAVTPAADNATVNGEEAQNGK